MYADMEYDNSICLCYVLYCIIKKRMLISSFYKISLCGVELIGVELIGVEFNWCFGVEFTTVLLLIDVNGVDIKV